MDDPRPRQPPPNAAPDDCDHRDGRNSSDDRAEGALPPVPWTLLDALGIFFLSLVLGSVLLALLQALLDDELARGVYFPASLAVLGGTAAGWIAVRHCERLRDLPGRRPTWRDVGAGFGHGALAFLGLNLGFSLILDTLARLTGGEMPVVQESLREAAQDGRVGFLVIASAVVVAPIAEELFFRGVLFRGLLGPLGAWPAIGTSALLFGLAHYEPGNLQGSLYALLVLASLGMYLAWAYNRRGTLLVPILMHSTFNGLAVVGILLGAAA